VRKFERRVALDADRSKTCFPDSFGPRLAVDDDISPRLDVSRRGRELA